ncbi:chromodomain-helicase-DNA-binding protein 1 [Drosophila guanche]|uniref:Blast:Chromobox protein homolog 5 n=1 Tax=Drosophila guanche TaxID=7266 RepID=A0A3B0L0J5_DROGU|nr:chromodomain-helicase-DNA-binding protein 1 [Drosophila guanche]SPP89918.1 blast:Chromobox protein homolog 5 [Drosophila guanche]
MGKLGKKKVAEEMSRKKSEAVAKQKNGNGDVNSDDGIDSKDGSSDKNDAASSLSGSSSQKQRSNQQKRKSSVMVASVEAAGGAPDAATKAKSKSKSKSIDGDSDDSDDLPLNGRKSSNSNESTGGGPPAKKPRKQAKPKSTKSGTAPSTSTAAAAKGKASNSKKKAAAQNIAANSDNDYEDAVDDESLAKSDDDSDFKQHDLEKEYEVEAIIGHKKVRGASFFLVRWKGYSSDSDTWEPESELNCDALIAEFRKKATSTQGGPLKGKGKGNDNGNVKVKTKKEASLKFERAAAAGKSAGGKKAAHGKQSSSKKSTDDPKKEWVVERIIDFVDDDEAGGLYRIRWKGFGAKDDTWEPEMNLSCEGLIRKFKRGLVSQHNVDVKELRESPKKTKRLVNECYPRTNIANRIERSSKRAAAKNRVFYGEE